MTRAIPFTAASLARAIKGVSLAEANPSKTRQNSRICKNIFGAP